jgi:hypothetical protein
VPETAAVVDGMRGELTFAYSVLVGREVVVGAAGFVVAVTAVVGRVVVGGVVGLVVVLVVVATVATVTWGLGTDAVVATVVVDSGTAVFVDAVAGVVLSALLVLLLLPQPARHALASRATEQVSAVRCFMSANLAITTPDGTAVPQTGGALQAAELHVRHPVIAALAQHQ